jgi:hypothetical protein
MMSLDKLPNATKHNYKKMKTESILKLNQSEAAKSKKAIEENRKQNCTFNVGTEIKSVVSQPVAYRPLVLSDKDNSSNASFCFLNRASPDGDLRSQEQPRKPLSLAIIFNSGIQFEVVAALFKMSAKAASLQIQISVFNPKADQDLDKVCREADILVVDLTTNPRVKPWLKRHEGHKKFLPLTILWTDDSRDSAQEHHFAAIDRFTETGDCAKLLLNCSLALL